MKIGIICANGRIGQYITNEAVIRGLDVTVIIRGQNKTTACFALEKDLFDLTKKDIELFDVLISTFGVWNSSSLILHSTSLMYLCDLLSGTQKRLYVVGCTGCLYVDNEHKKYVMDLPEYSKKMKPVAKAMLKALMKLQKRYDVQWKYVVPSLNFSDNNSKTGKYSIGGEEILYNELHKSIISYADFACFVLDEVQKENDMQKIISVVVKNY